MATIQDVANKAGVSVSTVSYALSGKRSITEATRERVMRAIDELDYHPNVIARGLVSQRSRMIGVMYPSETMGLSEGQMDVVLPITIGATQHGYGVMLWSAPLKPEEIWKLARENMLEGVVLMEVKRHDARAYYLQNKGIPFVLVGRCEKKDGLSFVDLDFNQAMHLCVNHLAQLGHRHIVLINASPELVGEGFNAALESAEGFNEAIEKKGMKGEVYSCRPSPRYAYDLVKGLLVKAPDITGAITIIDRVVPGIIQAVHAVGRHIPETFSLAANIGQRIQEMNNPPLTGTQTDVNVGNLAVEILVRKLEGKGVEPEQVLVSPYLTVRKSTGPCHC